MVRLHYLVATALAALALLVHSSPAAETFGNFHTMGVVLNVPSGYTPAQISEVRLYEVRATGDRRLQDPVQVGAYNYYAGSVFYLQPNRTYSFRADFYNTAHTLVRTETFAGSTRTEPGSLPAPRQEIHVATTGDNGYPGTAAQPKRTLGGAFAAVTQRGTHIVVHGGTYHEGDLNPPNDGTTSAPTVVRAADGEDVIFDGSAPQYFSSGWTSLGGGYYSRPFSGYTQLVAWRNKITGETFRCYPVATLAELNGKYSGTPSKTFALYNITGAYHFSGSLITLYCPAFTPGGNVEIRIPDFDTCIEHNQDPSVVYQDLTFRFFDGKGIYVNDSNDAIVRDCVFEYINVPVGVKRTSNRLLVEGCTFVDDCDRWGFLPKGPDGMYYSGAIENGAVMVYAPYDGRGLVVRNNTIDGLFDGMHLVPSQSPPAPRTSETDFYNNHIVSALDDLMEIDGFSRNVRVFNNRMENYLSGVSIAQAVEGPTYVLFNEFSRHGQTTASAIDGYEGYPVKSNGGTDYGNTGWVFFYHNTSWTDVPNTAAFRVQHAEWRQLIMANNIWYGTDTGWKVYRDVPLSPVRMDRDIVYQETGPFFHKDYGIPKDYATQQDVATSGLADILFLTNAVDADPLLTAPASGDFSLSPGSPGINAGVIIPGVNDELFFGAAPDIGASQQTAPSRVVTFVTVPPGLQLSIDGQTVTTPKNYTWPEGSVHTVEAMEPQPDGPGVRYRFATWSDGGAAAHDITVTGDITVSATFAPQYLWTVSATPSGAGSVAPPSGEWFDAATQITARAIATTGWTFDHWNGDLGGTETNVTVTMSAPRTAEAVFAPDGVVIEILTQPPALNVSVDGLPVTGGAFFSWPEDSVHTLSIPQTVQDGPPGTRFVFESWSDGETHTHSITATVPTAITATFRTEHRWTWGADPPEGGTVSPASSSWHTEGTMIQAVASPTPGFAFVEWSGDVSGSSATQAVTMAATTHAVATFAYTLPKLFVDADASGNDTGTSWANAFRDLQSALAAATPGDEIWVAEGVYKPGTVDTATFTLTEDTALYGGFAGNETALAQRDWQAHPTVLSGDIAGNDLPGFVNRTDNANHVVTGTPGAVLDGFTIRGGYAHKSSDDYDYKNFGGGIFLRDAACVVRNCLITDNSASLGGGMMAWLPGTSGSDIEHCVFRGNRALTMATSHPETAAGALIVGRGANIELDRCVFEENTSAEDGAAIQVIGKQSWTTPSSYVTLQNCLFAANTAANTGGAIATEQLASFDAVNCTFTSNSAALGGAMSNTNGLHLPVARNCILWENAAAVAPEIAGRVTVTYSAVQGGHAGNGNIGGDPLFMNAGEPAGEDDRYGTEDDGLRLLGGSPCLDTGTAAGAPNTAFDGVSRPQGTGYDMGAYEASGGLSCTFSAYPRSGFAPLAVLFTAAVSGGSGEGLYYRWDFDDDGTIDREGPSSASTDWTYGQWGAYSVSLTVSNAPGEIATARRTDYVTVSPGTIYVSRGGGHTPPFASWQAASTGIAEAVETALDGTTVLVSNGLYRVPAELVLSKAILLQAAFGRDVTFIDGRDTVRCVRLAHPDAVLSDFSLVNGREAYGGGLYFDSGGTATHCAISNNTATLGGAGVYMLNQGTLRDCVVANNSATLTGGGVHCENGGVVTGGVIRANWAGDDGGGIFLAEGGTVYGTEILGNSCGDDGGGGYCIYPGRFVACLVADNEAGDDGGGIQSGERYGILGGTVEQCTITGNTADDKAGGVFSWSSGLVRNCLIVSNTANYGGGASCRDGGLFINCTMANNTARIAGGGFHARDGGSSFNGIIDGNAASSNPEYYLEGTVHTFTYCCMSTAPVGAGNFAGDPLFVNAPSGDFRLTQDSDCIDRGTNADAPDGDIDGLVRPLDGDTNGLAIVDMGCYEFLHPSADSDRDGLPDGWEADHGLDPARSVNEDGPEGNPDGDAMDNMAEYAADTDPHDSQSYLAIEGLSLSGSTAELLLQGGENSRQFVDHRAVLSAGADWQTIVTNHPPTLTHFSLPMDGSGERAFYRIRAERP